MKQRRGLVLGMSMMALSMLACQVGGIGLGGAKTIRGSGNVVEETREVNGLSGVELATKGTLYIEVGSEESLRIEAEDNLMEYLETEVSGGRLRIGTRERVNLRNSEPIKYYLTVTALDTIKISSSGDIEAPALEADDFSVSIASSGNLEIDALNASHLKVSISSSGDLDIAAGAVETQDVTISSSGNYDAEDLESDEAEVRINSNGSATIWVRDSLKVNLNSSGDLRYRGNPTVDASTNSSGDVMQIGE